MVWCEYGQSEFSVFDAWAEYGHFLIPDFLGFGAPKWIFPTKIQNRIFLRLPYFVLVTTCMWGSQGTTLTWTKTQCSCNTVAIVKRNLTTCIK